MAQDDQPPGGLLSKVARFVRRPSLPWSDADAGDDRESLYSKHVLKEMIERKRANDFVRKREFEQLRKLRRAASGAAAAPAPAESASAFLDSEQPPASGQREGTLKKIDEIEAQMARQWPQGVPRAAPATPPPQEPGAGHARQFAPTVHIELTEPEARQTDFPPTDIQPMDPGHAPLDAVEDLLPGVDLSFGAQGEPGAELVLEPGLEEAAIRFANGDDAGAERALRGLLGEGTPLPSQERAWTALLDLFRATDQAAAFDALAQDYALRLQRPVPQWLSIPALAGQGAPAVPGRIDFSWSSPARLDAAELGALAARLVEARAEAVRLDWSALREIDKGALRPLAQLMDAWAGQQMHLQCLGVAELDAVLRRHTVSGQREMPADWWRLRLAWLRVCHRPDEFDLVALEYCITHEVAPPQWEEPLCSCGSEPGAPAALAGGGAAQLSGVLAGDASEALAALESLVQPDGQLQVGCEALLRVDFAAAGSVLNWAAAQQAAGRRVQFNGLHRLVAIFFHVVGIAEHAKIQARRA